MALIGRHVRAAGRIVVHGDYDVDGVCATAMMVRALRSLGADVGWFLPEPPRGRLRALARRPSSALRARGTSLLITVDCGITAVEEVAAARRGGDRRRRHRPPRPAGRRRAARLPDRASRRVRLPVPGAVRHRASPTSSPRRSARPRPRMIELVALATVADLMPLRGREPPARARGARRAGEHGQARAARADGRLRASTRARSTRTRSASGSRRGSTPPAGSAAPTPASSCC